MRTTIDKAGRLVLPKVLRDEVGVVAGEVEVYTSGSSIVIEPVGFAQPVEVDGRLLLPSSGETVTVDQIRELRLRDQR